MHPEALPAHPECDPGDAGFPFPYPPISVYSCRTRASLIRTCWLYRKQLDTYVAFDAGCAGSSSNDLWPLNSLDSQRHESWAINDWHEPNSLPAWAHLLQDHPQLEPPGTGTNRNVCKITASTTDFSVSSTWNRLASVWSSTQRKCLLWCSVAVLRSRTERQAVGRQKPGRSRQGKNSCNDDFSLKLYNEKKKLAIGSRIALMPWAADFGEVSCSMAAGLVLDGSGGIKGVHNCWLSQRSHQIPKSSSDFWRDVYNLSVFFHSDFLICSIKYR